MLSELDVALSVIINLLILSLTFLTFATIIISHKSSELLDETL